MSFTRCKKKKVTIVNNGGIYLYAGAYYVLPYMYQFLTELDSGEEYSFDFLTPVKEVKNQPRGLLKFPSLSKTKIVALDKGTAVGIKRAALWLLRLLKYCLFNRKNFYYFFIPGTKSFISIVALKFLNGKSLNYACYYRNDFTLNWHLRWLKKTILKDCNFVLVTGEELGKDAELYTKSVQQVSPMLSFDYNSIRASQISKANYISKGIVRMAYVGQINVKKGVLKLPKICQVLTEQGWNVELTLAGSGDSDLVEKVRIAFSESSPSTKFQYVGRIKTEAVKELLLKSDFIVHPTSYPEGFPRIFYEAMLCKCLIVTYDKSLFRWMLKDDFINIDNLMKKGLAINKSEYESLIEIAHSRVIDYLGQFKGNSHAAQLLENLK